MLYFLYPLFVNHLAFLRMEPSTQKTSPTIPIAIVCGFALIALAIFFTSGRAEAPTTNERTAAQSENSTPRPVDETDYIRGNPNAPIMMVEYSDYDCPFCKQYHATMQQIMDEYGVTGKVAWTYRQFPLQELHPNAPRISEAALCVGDIGGTTAFWDFSDRVFEDRDVDEFTNVTKLPRYAVDAGVSEADYVACLNEGRMQERLESDMRSAINAGANSTPYTVVMVGNQQFVISGAQPYETVKGIVENLIDQLDGNFDPDAVEERGEVPTNSQGMPILE